MAYHRDIAIVGSLVPRDDVCPVPFGEGEGNLDCLRVYEIVGVEVDDILSRRILHTLVSCIAEPSVRLIHNLEPVVP